MQTKIFAIHDTKACCFRYPCFFPSTGQAIRSFTLMANDQQGEIGKFPEEFTLYEVGTFDDQTGMIERFEVPKSLGFASDYLKKDDGR